MVEWKALRMFSNDILFIYLFCHTTNIRKTVKNRKTLGAHAHRREERCLKPILWELNSFLMSKFYFFPINLQWLLTSWKTFFLRSRAFFSVLLESQNKQTLLWTLINSEFVGIKKFQVLPIAFFIIYQHLKTGLCQPFKIPSAKIDYTRP